MLYWNHAHVLKIKTRVGGSKAFQTWSRKTEEEFGSKLSLSMKGTLQGSSINGKETKT